MSKGKKSKKRRHHQTTVQSATLTVKPFDSASFAELLMKGNVRIVGCGGFNLDDMDDLDDEEWEEEQKKTAFPQVPPCKPL